jgi:hypothetical protein
MGAPILIEVPPHIKIPMNIAFLELKEKVLPISIKRTLPDKTSQNVSLKTLIEEEEKLESLK